VSKTQKNGKMIKGTAAGLTVVLLGTVFAACNDAVVAAPLAVGNKLTVIEGMELDYDNAFFDDFTGGVDPANWYIGKQSWGANGNGGVVPENVNYTDDGVLVFTGNGEYYTEGDVKSVGVRRDGTLSGGALISKFVTGPGRYEIKMKALPRLGACSAFWTFAFDNDTNGNHEIDIELPGGNRSHAISFENVLNTNYITEQLNLSNDVDISAATGGKITNFADGEWHTFGFDWYTLEEGDDESRREEDGSCGKVVYYVDGVVTTVNDIFVPYYQSRLWLGVWFPNNSGFVGDANFATDYMYVDWVRYTPFVGQPAVEFVPAITGDVASENEYPKAPVATVNVNKIANGDFEYVLDGKTNSGWGMYKRAIEDADLKLIRDRIAADNPEMTASEVRAAANEERKRLQGLDAGEYITVADGVGYKSSSGIKIEKIGLAGHTVDSVYDGFTHEFKFRAKGKGTFNVVYMGHGTAFIEEKRFDIDSEDWREYTFTYTAPAGTKRVEIELTSGFDVAAYFDDVSMRLV